MNKLPKIFTGILLWASFVLPIYLFEKSFLFFSIETSDLAGVYPDAIWSFSLLAIGITLMTLWISRKAFHKNTFKGLIIIVNFGFYGLACTSIAWDYRIIFGATWQWTEIFPALVQPQWYFYAFGITGILCNYLLQKFIVKQSN